MGEPQWKDFPDEPGSWLGKEYYLRPNGTHFGFAVRLCASLDSALSEMQTEEERQCETAWRWFGPIPQDPQEVQQ